MANALVSIQILPHTSNGDVMIPFVDRAIAMIQDSGVKYWAGPLETTMEGELSQLIELVRSLTEKYRP